MYGLWVARICFRYTATFMNEGWCEAHPGGPKSIYSMRLIIINELVHEISNNVVCATSKASDQPAHTQSDQSLCKSLEYSMIVKLLTEHHWSFLS